MTWKSIQSLFERILFGTIALLLVMVIWMGFSVYSRLNNVSETQLPTDFLENSRFLVRELSNNILKSDNLSFAYLYQENSDALLDIEILESQTKRKLSLLKSYKKSDTAFQRQLDRLDKLINQRFANLDTLMGIKNENRVDETMQLVANEVEQATLETNLKLEINEQAKQSPINEDSKKRLFKRKPKATETSQSNVNARDIANESAKSISSKINKVRKHAVSKEDLQNSYKWQLEQRNIELSKQINSLFQSIDQTEKKLLVSKTLQAKSVAQETNQIILSFSGISSVFIILIVILIITLFRKSKETNYQLRLAKEKSDYLTEAKSQFLATMSHEIRTPLNAISGFTEQLFFEKLPSAVASKVAIIQSSVKHLVQITNEILDLSKLEKNEIQFEEIPFNPRTEIMTIKSQFQFLLAERNNSFEFEASPDLPNYIGDPLRYRQIIINLISNANKFTKDGTIYVLLSTSQLEDKSWHEIRVRDTGIGMDSFQLERIFEPFEQADLTVTRKYGGTGLGLSITKQIVEGMKGTISVQSELEKGTEFIILLPLEITSESITSIESPAPTNFDFLQGKTIIIADDEPFNRTLLKSIFHPVKLNLLEAENGIEALKIIDENQVDLALLDVRMPEMNGHDLVQELQKRGKLFPIIGLTATLTPENKTEMIETGWTDVLTKPVNPDQLKQVILHVMNNETIKSDVVNLEGLRTLTNNNEIFYNELIDTFLQSTANGMDQIKTELKKENWKQLGELAHQYAAPFKHFEAQNCYETLKKIELFGKEESNLDEIPSLVETFLKQAESVIDQVKINR